MKGRAVLAPGLVLLALGGVAVFLLARDDSSPDPRRPSRIGKPGKETSPGTLPSGEASATSGSPSSLPPSPATSPSRSPPSSGKATVSSKGDPVTSAPQPSTTGPLPVKNAAAGKGPVVLVVGPDEKPIAGALVAARTIARTLPPVRTGRDGEARLAALEPGESFSGAARHPRFAQPAEFEGKPGAMRVVARFAECSTGTIGGYLHDQKGVVPKSAVLSIADEQDHELRIPCEAFDQWDPSRNGLFRLAVAPGRYTVSASAEGYAPSDKCFPTVAQGEESAVELVLERGSAISGKVALPPDLLSSLDPVVLAFDLECRRGTETDQPTTYRTTTEAPIGPDGSFRLDGVRWGVVRVRATDGKSRAGSWAVVPLAEGQSVENVGLTLEAAFTSVRGKVQDPAGKPIAGAHVASQHARVDTDAEGAFDLRGLDPGKQDVTVDAGGYGRGFVTVEVPPLGHMPPHVSVTLLPYGKATGKVVRQGAPAAGVKVLAVLKVRTGGMKPCGPVVSGKDGAWTIEDLEPGNYFLKVGEDVDPFDEAGAPTFKVWAGTAANVPAVEAP